MKEPRISEINHYPIKSCAGTRLQKARVGLRGIEHDRRWMIVDEKGVAITQRNFPSMALIVPTLVSNNGGDAELKLTAPGAPDFPMTKVPASAQPSKVEVWGNICDAADQGDAVAEWLSAYIKTACRLVEMDSNFARIVDQDYAITAKDQVSFADGYPLLLISQASLDDLNKRLDQPVLMDRFRPNIVVDGTDAFEEDTWDVIRIGDVKLSVVKPCARCVMVTIEQSTATPGKEPLRTLSQYRQVKNKVLFGQNLIHHAPGSFSLGDQVEVLSTKQSAAASNN